MSQVWTLAWSKMIAHLKNLHMYLVGSTLPDQHHAMNPGLMLLINKECQVGKIQFLYMTLHSVVETTIDGGIGEQGREETKRSPTAHRRLGESYNTAIRRL